ncbi:MAG: glycosyltransferase, partial [Syntrophobacteraceae bacterium]
RYDDLIEWIRGNTRFPRAVWLIDTHCILKRHRNYSKKFHYVFMAISKYVEQFKRWNPNTFWLPLCYPERSDTIAATDHPKQYDISFVGHYLRKEQKLRKKMLEIVRKEFGEKLLVKTDYENMHRLIGSSRVSFNCSTGQDLNFRIWEVMANGVELVTDIVPDIYKIPGLAGRIHLYDNKKEMLRCLHTVLDGSAAKDPAEARDWVKGHHCMVHRHRAMLRMIRSNIQERF